LTAHRARLVVQVKPGAKAPGIILGPDGAIVVRVREPAMDGRATAAVREALARALGVPKSSVTLVRGAASRMKAFDVDGLGAGEARIKLSRAAER
jgi:uncharacterized protein YggU (UPF0235/DUF167 family)